MTKQFEMNMPQETVNAYLKECGYNHSWGNENEMKFANLCATWGANQEYQESWNFIHNAWGTDHASVYQESRRPKIQSKKEKAIEALNYIDEMAICNLTNYTCIDDMRRHRKFLYKLIESMPDDDS